MFVDPNLAAVVAFVCSGIDYVVCWCAEVWFVAGRSSFLYEYDVVV